MFFSSEARMTDRERQLWAQLYQLVGDQLAVLYRPTIERELTSPISDETIQALSMIGHAMDSTEDEEEATDLYEAKCAQEAGTPVPEGLIDRVTRRRLTHWTAEVVDGWLSFLCAYGKAKGGVSATDLNSAMLPTLTYETQRCYDDEASGARKYGVTVNGELRWYADLSVYDGMNRQALEAVRRRLPRDRFLPEAAEDYLLLQGMTVIREP
jgi:hypothetical protein